MRNTQAEIRDLAKRSAQPAKVLEFAAHPAWIAFVKLCSDLRYGDIERVRIQDGVPVLAEVVKQKVKFV